jgi:SpoIID/LytB domain protein
MSEHEPRTRRTKILLCASALLAGTLVAPATTAEAAAVQVYRLPTAGKVEVTEHGNGHGHGLSQYGARGAADAGLSPRQILAFYYPGTSLVRLSSIPRIRVLLSGGYAHTCVNAKPGLRATAVSTALPSTGSLQIVPWGSGLELRAFAASHCNGKVARAWVRAGATSMYISSADHYVRLRMANGSSTDYYGEVGAVRNGSGELTVDVVSLDRYAQGVTPREMPASWNFNAVKAQAIAARTYGLFEMSQSGPGALYDICDTTACQVYGGKTHYGADGRTVLWQDDPAAATSTVGQVIVYRGSVAFAQYSASNGGRTADGGEPYLIARTDPYDNAASGDPYLSITTTASVNRIAAAYGLKTVTQIEITGRDQGRVGHVTSATVRGRTRAGANASVYTTGSALQSVMGLSSTDFSIGWRVPAGGVLASPIIHVAGSHPGGAQLRWDPVPGARQYHLYRNGKPTSKYVHTTSVTVRRDATFTVVAMADAAGRVHSDHSNEVTVRGI